MWKKMLNLPNQSKLSASLSCRVSKTSFLGIVLIVLFLIFFLSNFIIVLGLRGPLNCTVNSSCAYSEILKISDLANAHAELANYSNYANIICCWDTAGDVTLNTSCSGRYITLLHLSNETNAHVELNNASSYNINLCMNVSNGNLSVGYASSCSAYDTCFASVSTAISGGDSNLQIADCTTDPYTTKVCVSITNNAPTTPEIGGPENASRTVGNSQTLRCANSTDVDGDTINYVFYADSTTPSTTVRQNSTATTYIYSTTDGLTYYWRCKAEDGVGGVSAFTAEKTFTENSLPTIVYLVYPAHAQHVTNVSTSLNWSNSSDAEGDSLIYEMNITCLPACSTDNRRFNLSDNFSANLTIDLKYYWDDNNYYNWTVRVWDGYEISAFNATPHTFYLDSSIVLTIMNSTVNFTGLGLGQGDDTSDNSPFPFRIRNDGNSFVRINMSAESMLWTRYPTASSYYQYKVDNATGEEGAFKWSTSITAWTNVPLVNNSIIDEFNYTTQSDEAEIDVQITVPTDEPPGNKLSNITFTGWYMKRW